MPTKPAPKTVGFEPVAGLLAFLFPGLGHFFLGEKSRAIAIAAGMLGLIFIGLLTGGIDAVDSKQDKLWYIPQAIAGPVVFGVDYINQTRLKGVDLQASDGSNARVFRTPNPGEELAVQTDPQRPGQKIRVIVPKAGAVPAKSKSISHMNEVGTLFVALAGMLNLIVILDALFPGMREAVPVAQNKPGVA